MGHGHHRRGEVQGRLGAVTRSQYLVRQMGLIVTSAGASAVAVAVEPYSGSFTDGIRVLNQIAEWLSEHIVMLPSARCPRWPQRVLRRNEPVSPRSR